jgi:hypothetical protein
MDTYFISNTLIVQFIIFVSLFIGVWTRVVTSAVELVHNSNWETPEWIDKANTFSTSCFILSVILTVILVIAQLFVP